MAKKSPLGRGLSALIADANTDNSPQKAMSPSKVQQNLGFLEIDINHIHRNDGQPRTYFNEGAINELANSIKTLGLIQPITVRQISEGNYQIIAGERRYRASKLAGLKTIPCYVRKVNDDEVLAMALVENIQRENLDAIEVGISFQRLIEEFSLTQEQLSEKVGKKRSTIANYIRLLKLPALVQKALKENMISMGHARTLVGIEKNDLQIHILDTIIEKDLSVRATEELVRTSQEEKSPKKTKSTENTTTTKWEERGKSIFQRKISVSINEEGRGKITIPFISEEDLDNIFQKMK